MISSQTSFNVPILLLGFNRPSLIQKVLHQIDVVRPNKLYVALDGPRDRVPEDSKSISKIKLMIDNLGWNCNIKTLYRDDNLGCKKAVSSAIDWFFKHEERGIILEDDCVPSHSFFRYCEELLDKYETDMRVWHISGDNFQGTHQRGDGDYYFSIHNHIWGWATWRNRWNAYDVGLKKLRTTEGKNILKVIWTNRRLQKYWYNILDKTYHNKIDTWDYQWKFTIWINHGLAALPNKNLVSNIGFGEGATHTKNKVDISSNLPTEDLEFPLKHPSVICRHVEADDFTNDKLFGKRIIFTKVSHLAKSIFNKIKLTLLK